MSKSPAETQDWFEDEEFWRETWDFVFSEERLAGAADEAAAALELAGIEADPEVCVLDLPCGPGRHAMEFARRGLAATGVDKTPYLLAEARRAAADAGLEVEWVREDMRDFRRPGAFDLALNAFSSFGYFSDPANDFKVLENFAVCLQPSGKLVMDLLSKEIFIERFQPSTSFDLPDGGVLIDRREVFDDWGSTRSTWHLIRGDAAKTYSFELRLYSAREIKDLLKRAKFTEIEIYGDWQGSSYGPGASRMIVAATAPAGSRIC